MANKTIYVKDADLPLWDKAQDHFHISVSAAFSDFLRERVGEAARAEVSPELERVPYATNIEVILLEVLSGKRSSRFIRRHAGCIQYLYFVDKPTWSFIWQSIQPMERYVEHDDIIPKEMRPIRIYPGGYVVLEQGHHEPQH